MTDPISSSGGIRNIGLQDGQGNKTRPSKDEAGKSDALTPKDEVSISAEALDQASAEKAAKEAKVALEASQDTSLGLDPNFDITV